MTSDLAEVKGVGPALEQKLAGVGVRTMHDLAQYYPRRYDDFSVVTPIVRLKPGPVTIQAQIKQAKGRYVRRGMHVTEAAASDETGSVHLTWFNQPYRADALKPGKDYFISGEFGLHYRRLSIMNPSVELVSEFPVSTARIVPIYRETKGLTSKQLRRVMREAVPYMRSLPDPLPEWIRARHKLVSYGEALESLHFPASRDVLSAAKRRLAYQEVFELILASLYIKKEIATETAVEIPFSEALAKEFVGHLPFKLTDAQRKVIWQVYKDMAGIRHLSRSHASAMQGADEQRSEPYRRYGEGVAEVATQQSAANVGRVSGSAGKQASVVRVTQPMNRLVEGDVGSGKTVVAAMAALMVMKADHQTALMAPTEILARQHAETLYKLLEPLGYADQVALLVGGMKKADKERAREAIAAGRASIIVGTHALIQESVDMHRLALVVIDEQHRFGVDQRKTLMKKAGVMPHVLSLTATPIPRSLALTVYGELDVSLLDAKPPGRQPVITKICSPNSRKQLYEQIEQELQKGRQMFVVCPLISETTGSKVRSAETVQKELSTAFKPRTVGLLHGKMRPAEKNRVMEQFLSHELDILVSTTVIEVGVDVPNASIMLVESAERFGLAQLHQLRGRVGRGGHKGHCYLMLSDSSPPSPRLKALETSNDGFKLAELDLELRGPGAIYGTMQHGALDLRLAKLTDTRLIAAARKDAEEFIGRGENLLQYPQLAAHVTQLQKVTNLN